MANLYDIPVKLVDGTATSLAAYKGQVLLIVNVASKCGLTPQYDGLEKLYEQYREKGFSVLGFPANNFAQQEPGTNQEIQEFCRTNFGVKFPIFEKISVKGPDQHPLYQYLTDAEPEIRLKPGSPFESKLKDPKTREQKPDILWNFEKFLIDREGHVASRFAPDVKPDDEILVQAIEQQI